jgi:hypothetical protein
MAVATSGQLLETAATLLEAEFPITSEDAEVIVENLREPQSVAEVLVARFSPKWFIGWRDICRSTDERTLIASAIPKAAIGHTFPLAFSAGMPARMRLLLLANLNSFVADYIARQKVGGTHITYGLLKQFPILTPTSWGEDGSNNAGAVNPHWFVARVLELVYTAHDLTSLARDCGYHGPPFLWDETRRFEIRCELDAAFFHLYLPSNEEGNWRKVEQESESVLEEVRNHFPTPRDAVAHILDQFPVVRQKDEQEFGHYRTKDRVIAIYDLMLSATRCPRPYHTAVDPAPEMWMVP